VKYSVENSSPNGSGPKLSSARVSSVNLPKYRVSSKTKLSSPRFRTTAACFGSETRTRCRYILPVIPRWPSNLRGPVFCRELKVNSRNFARRVSPVNFAPRREVFRFRIEVGAITLARRTSTLRIVLFRSNGARKRTSTSTSGSSGTEQNCADD